MEKQSAVATIEIRDPQTGEWKQLDTVLDVSINVDDQGRPQFGSAYLPWSLSASFAASFGSLDAASILRQLVEQQADAERRKERELFLGGPVDDVFAALAEYKVEPGWLGGTLVELSIVPDRDRRRRRIITGSQFDPLRQAFVWNDGRILGAERLERRLLSLSERRPRREARRDRKRRMRGR